MAAAATAAAPKTGVCAVSLQLKCVSSFAAIVLLAALDFPLMISPKTRSER
jgi:hypothetical protein